MISGVFGLLFLLSWSYSHMHLLTRIGLAGFWVVRVHHSGSVDSLRLVENGVHRVNREIFIRLYWTLHALMTCRSYVLLPLQHSDSKALVTPSPVAENRLQKMSKPVRGTQGTCSNPVGSTYWLIFADFLADNRAGVNLKNVSGVDVDMSSYFLICDDHMIYLWQKTVWALSAPTTPKFSLSKVCFLVFCTHSQTLYHSLSNFLFLVKLYFEILFSRFQGDFFSFCHFLLDFFVFSKQSFIKFPLWSRQKWDLKITLKLKCHL